jgi:hypothetical protein
VFSTPNTAITDELSLPPEPVTSTAYSAAILKFMDKFESPYLIRIRPVSKAFRTREVRSALTSILKTSDPWSVRFVYTYPSRKLPKVEVRTDSSAVVQQLLVLNRTEFMGEEVIVRPPLSKYYGFTHLIAVP